MVCITLIAITFTESLRFASKINKISSIVNSVKMKRLSIISACMGISILSSACLPPAHAVALESLLSIRRGSEAVDYILDHIDDDNAKGVADTGKLFEQVDFMIKNFNFKNRLDIAVYQTPDEFRSCAKMKSDQITGDLNTLMEYFSVSLCSVCLL